MAALLFVALRRAVRCGSLRGASGASDPPPRGGHVLGPLYKTTRATRPRERSDASRRGEVSRPSPARSALGPRCRAPRAGRPVCHYSLSPAPRRASTVVASSITIPIASGRQATLATDESGGQHRLLTVNSLSSGAGSSFTLLDAADVTGPSIQWPGGDAWVEWEGEADGATLTLETDAIGSGTWKVYAGATATDQDSGAWIVTLPLCSVRMAVANAGALTSISAIIRGA